MNEQNSGLCGEMPIQWKDIFTCLCYFLVSANPAATPNNLYGVQHAVATRRNRIPPAAHRQRIC